MGRSGIREPALAWRFAEIDRSALTRGNISQASARQAMTARCSNSRLLPII